MTTAITYPNGRRISGMRTSTSRPMRSPASSGSTDSTSVLDRHRRARPEDGRDRRARGCAHRGAGPAQLRCVPAAAGAAEHLIRSVHSHHRCRPYRGVHGDLEADVRRRGDIDLGLVRGLVLGARREASSPRTRRVGADGTRVAVDSGAPSTGPRSRPISSGSPRTPTSYWRTTRSIRSSSDPTCDATRWSASSPADCATCRSRGRRSTGACRCPITPTSMYVWVDALTNYLTGVGFPDTDSECSAGTGPPTCT